MMTIDFDFNTLFKDVDQKIEDYSEVLDREFARAGAFLVKKFQDEQLSGRKGDDTGLNVRTGNLRQSIKSMIQSDSDGLKSVIFNTGAEYWQYHQTGTDKLKKRLFLEEDFEYSGEKAYTSAIELAEAALG